MIKRKKSTNRKNIFTGMVAAALFLLAGSTSWADPDMGSGHKMKMDGHGHMGMNKDMSYGMHGIRPHNAAEHFLTMTSTLNLTDTQIKQLTKLRDEYIDKNAVTEQQLNAAYGDLPRVLYADDVDMTSVNALIDKIGKLESQLWHAYAQQLHDIKAMLTLEQKKGLTESWEKAHREMGGMHEGDMPMHRDSKSSH